MLYQDPEITLEEKKAILEKEIEGDKSDEIVRYRLTCEAGLPSKEKKAELWKWYMDEKATDSDKILDASMLGFWDWQQLDIIKVYIDKFFESFVDICKKRTSHYSVQFFMHLSPGIASPEILKKYEELLKALPEEFKARRKSVEAEIDNQKRLLKAYDASHKYYSGKK